MSQTKEIGNISNPFARNAGSSQVKKPQQPIQKLDSARENVKKQLTEAFENANDLSNEINNLTEQLVIELENIIYDMTGKNSKDKMYREKAKKIISRLKGNRNSVVRDTLKNQIITVSDFCHLNDKQLDDDSYFEKLSSNGNLPVSKAVKPKSGTRPPEFKNLPVIPIDLTSSNSEAMNNYFNTLNQNNEDSQPQENIPKLNTFNEDGGNIENLQIENSFQVNQITVEDSKGVNLSQIDCSSVKTDNYSVREDNRAVPAEIGKDSPKLTNGRTIQYHPPKTNPPMASVNQTFDIGVNKNTEILKANTASNKLVSRDDSQVVNSMPSSGKNDKLEELKKLMEQKKLGKNMNLPANKKANARMTENPTQISSSDKITKEINANEKDNTNFNLTQVAEQEKELNIIQSSIIGSKIPLDKPSNDEKIELNQNYHVKENNVNSEANNNNTENNFINISTGNVLFANVNPFNEEDYFKQNKQSVPRQKFDQSHNNLKNNKLNIVKEQNERIKVENIEKKEEFSQLNNNKISNESVNIFEINREPERPIDNFAEVNSALKVEPLNMETKTESVSIKTSSNFNLRENSSCMSRFKDKYNNFQEIKINLETELELANKKCDLYQKELDILRKSTNEYKLKLSKTNEEGLNLEISKLKHSLSAKERENEILSNENDSLKLQLKRYEETLENLIEENKKFRIETDKKFVQYSKEIENLIVNRNNNITNNIVSNIKESFTEKRGEQIEKEESLHLNNPQEHFVVSNYHENNQNSNNYKRDNARIKLSGNTNNNMEINNLHSGAHNKSNRMEQDVEENFEEDHMIDSSKNNYNDNNFTNGNPNIIEEVGSDNYLNMNGNTYDEMKDLNEEEHDNLQDHQYYENVHSKSQIISENHIYSKFNNTNTGEISHIPASNTKKNVFTSNDNKKGESGATNNIFSNFEEEKEVDESHNFFSKKQNPHKKENEIKKNNNINSIEKTTKSHATNIGLNKVQLKEDNNIFNKKVKPNNHRMDNNRSHNQNNIFEDNAIDIFDKTDNMENIFDAFSTMTNKNKNENNIFD